MATKWKELSNNRLLKNLLILAYLACFCAMGIITGFAPANGYLNSRAMNTLFADNYFTSDDFAERLRSASYNLVSKMTDFNFIERPDISDFQWSINGLSTIDSDAVAVYRIDNQQIYTEKGTQPASGHAPQYYDSTYKIAFTYSQLKPHIAYWEAVQWNLRVIVVSDILLFILSAAILALLCPLVGSQNSGEKKTVSVLSVFYEVELAVFCLATYGAFGILASYDRIPFVIELLTSDLGRKFFMCIFGFTFAIEGALLLWIICSAALRSNRHELAKGSLIYRLAELLWRGLKFCGRQPVRLCRFLKELFTGESFRATAAKKHGIIDLIYIAATLVMGAFLYSCTQINYYGYTVEAGILAMLIILGEIVLTALFLYGRTLILKDSAQLEKQISKIYEGDYTFRPQLSQSSSYAQSSERLSRISEQYSENIKRSIQAERTKIELVTNVSHDLKTPLTSIISYIELLSKEELSPAASDYVNILKNKSARLKAIISDVFELAKTTSGEIAVEHEIIDLSKLCYQTLGEMEDRIAKSGLEIRTAIAEPPVTIVSDGKRIYRILQNLLDNALKYSLKGTRIYFTLAKDDKQAVITIKNISAYEMTFTKEEILERFTRGDKSRTTEGSGLGLSIAQGFTIACGGSFDIELDGDMFKTIITFPLKSAQPEIPSEQNTTEQTDSDGAVPSQSAAEAVNTTNSSDNAAAEISPEVTPNTEVRA